ncbi:MAG: hypothetical protein RLZZ306_360 [Bacteroidota bacterium]|jgi:predicted GH43/DUF377 family glycosyl hydrolase
MKRLILIVTFSIFCEDVFAQKSEYIDKRPQATLRMDAIDEGIVLKYGNGQDSCDVYGAREAIVNEENGNYYLFYDGAGKDGWRACLAESRDLKTWTKKGAILNLGIAGSNDSKSASSPWVIKEKDTWHMFYLGTPNTSPAPDRIPMFPYLTMKAKSKSFSGPWVKQYDVEPLPLKKGTYYAVTASPGFVVKTDKEYLQFFSATTQDTISGIKRTLGIARTNDLNTTWKIDSKPIVPLEEQIENSSIYYDEESKTWFLFTNHIGIDSLKTEYTDAIWVYWSKNINKWDVKNKAIVLDKNNCKWSKGAIGMPSVIKKGNRLAILYDAYEGYSTYHMKRNIGLAWLSLPLVIPNKKKN